ncbi:MAG: hypothetical protein KAH32_06790 [Chlamydiia bacterium]|nr:hypothetical protein [Chlamydiia bacterium]
MLENVLAGGLVSKELPAGVHENVRLVSIDPTLKKDNNGNDIGKQLFIKFVKYSEFDEVLGEKVVTFFFLRPDSDYVTSSLAEYILDLRSILEIFKTEEEVDEAFNVLESFVGEGWTEDEIKDAFNYENIGIKVLNKDSKYVKLQKIIRDSFYDILQKEIGVDSKFLRLKLVSNDTGEYIQLPRNTSFIESAEISKETSRLY